MNFENLEFNDDDFGWSNISEYTSHQMALVQAKPELAVPVLSEVVSEWPDVYAAGGRKIELIALIARVLNKHMLIAILILFLIPVALGEVEGTVGRVKREGFGPWEQDDTINIVSSWAKDVVNTVVKEEKKIVEAVEKTVEKVEAEVKVLIVSSGRIIVWTVAVLAIAVLLRLTYPFIVAILRLLWTIIMNIARFVIATTCCMKCCAFAPFVAIRNWYRSRKLRMADEAVQIEDAVALQPTAERCSSEVFFDEFGPYVRGSYSEKIYFSRQQLDVQTYMALGAPPSDRFKEERVKETMLARSVPHTTKALPDFQAYFTSEGNVVGHCARITFKGQTCLLTAYHVLSYNIKADLFLNANGKAVRFSDVRVRALAYSKENDLDYIVLAVPDTICSKLGLKKAKLARGLSHGQPITIHQFIGGSSCYTVGIAQKADRPWMISYGASTVEGSSGAPILNTRKEIVGVHVEGGKTNNTGIIPELLRTIKESPQNGDINGEDPRSTEVDYQSDEEREEDYEDLTEDYETYHQYLAKATKDGDVKHQSTSWGAIMEELDDDYERTGRSVPDPGYLVYAYKTDNDQQGRHIGLKIKRGRIRKESPWTCSKCLTLHLKAGYNCAKCGYALKPTVKEVFDQKKEIVAESVTPVIADKINESLEALSLKYQNLEKIIKTILEDVRERHPCGPPDYAGVHYGPIDKIRATVKAVPKEVSMDSKLARTLQTAPVSASYMSPYLSKVRTAQNGLSPAGTGVHIHQDVSWDEKSPIVASAPMQIEVIKNKPKRKRRTPKKKETVSKDTKSETAPSAVHLNSKSPSKGGVTITHGQTKPVSQTKVKLSAGPSVPSTQPNKALPANSGKRPLGSTHV